MKKKAESPRSNSRIANVSEREREREKKSVSKPGDRLESLGKDWSAEERYVNRSFRIRRRVRQWLEDNIQTTFPTSSEMSDICAFDVRCSPITAYRWIRFWSNPSAPFLIEEQPSGHLSIRMRSE